ncbi:MAG: hypothetical protein NTX75_12950 [Proteobacteria bacterium]|nr:hypothetical protein [Pseudomonadota bacterium]
MEKEALITTTISSLRKAAEYLEKAGWAVKRQTITNHARAGLIRKNVQGQYDTKTLDRYAMANLKRLDGAPITGDDKYLATLQKNKLEATTQIAIEQAQFMKNRNRDFEAEWEAIKGTELAARAALFKNDLETFVRSKTLDIINIVHGDPVLAPDLIAFILASIDGILLRYVQTGEFEIDRETYQRFLDSMTATVLAVSTQADAQLESVEEPPA